MEVVNPLIEIPNVAPVFWVRVSLKVKSSLNLLSAKVFTNHYGNVCFYNLKETTYLTPNTFYKNLQNLTRHLVWNVLRKSVLLSFCQVVKQSFKVKYSLNLRSAKAFTTHYGNVGLCTLKRNHSFYPLIPFTKPVCALFYLAYWVCNTYLLCLT